MRENIDRMEKIISIEDLDQVSFYFISGIIIQVILFHTCNVWLMYLPPTYTYFLNHTLLFSLYLTHKLPSLKQSPQPQNLQKIFEHLNNKLYGYTLPDHLKSVKYLLSVIVFYNIPSFLGLFVTYIIIAQNYGHDHAESILNIQILLTGSLFTIINTLQISVLLSFSIALIAFTLMFSDASIFKPKTFFEQFFISCNNLKQIVLTKGITDKVVIFMIISLLFTPIVPYIPVISILAPLLNSTSWKITQIVTATILLGQRCQQFFFPSMHDDYIERCCYTAKTKARQVVQYLPYLEKFFTAAPSRSHTT